MFAVMGTGQRQKMDVATPPADSHTKEIKLTTDEGTC